MMGPFAIITTAQPPLLWAPAPVRQSNPAALDARVEAQLQRLQQRSEAKMQQFWK